MMPDMVAAHWYDAASKDASNQFLTVTRQKEASSPTSVAVVPTGVAGKEADESPPTSDPKLVESASRFQWLEEDSTNLMAFVGANDENDKRNGESEPHESDALSKPSPFVTSPSQTTQQTTITGNTSAQARVRGGRVKQERDRYACADLTSHQTPT